MIRPSPRRVAFTLVEMTVVVLLIAVLAATVVLSFARPIENLRAQDAVEMVRALDESARTQARRSGETVEIIFDLSARTLLRRTRAGDVIFEAALPSGCEIDRFRSEQDDASVGEAVVACSPMGLTRSYAIHLTGPRMDQWLLFAGLSGQATVIKDEATLDSIFSSPRRGDDAR